MVLLLVFMQLTRDLFAIAKFMFTTGRICPKGSSAGIAFTHGPIFRIFRPAGATLCTDQGEIWQAKFHLDRFRGVGLRPQNFFFKLEFYQYNCS